MKVSLVIPCYNESKNIPQLLESCRIAFKGKDIEVVIVNNGSTDNTQEVLNSALTSHLFVKVVMVGWTHADLQTDPADVNTALNFFEQSASAETILVKGRRHGRPFADVFFTIGMALFESVLMKTWMWDINAQPTLFHRSFFQSWDNPPNDFSLDLFAYYLAKNKKFTIKRFPVLFSERMYGVSSWNINWTNKYKFIKRTLQYSFLLNNRIKK